MKIKKIVTLITILLITAAGSIIIEDIKAVNSPATYHVRAQESDIFVESMGINTKFGFCPGNLCNNYPEVKDLLADLGIRYIRDFAYPEPWRIRTDLYEDLGIRMVAGTARTSGKALDSENISALIIAIKSWGKMIAGIVGVNEHDSDYNSCEENPEACDPNWSEQNWPRSYVEFQQRLYDRVKADPKLHHLPVVMGPMAYLNSLEGLEDEVLSAICDKGNDHPYPGAWGKPSQVSGGGNPKPIDEVVAEVQRVCPGKKLWITETGYEEKSEGERNKKLVTRKAKAKYLPRIYTNYFQQGQIEKTFLHELMPPGGNNTHFGIIDTNLQPTPAYYGIKNMISLLGEANWDRQTQSWDYPAVETNSLKYILEGDLTDIKHLLLQKSDGTFYLLLWQEVYVYDDRQGRDIINPDRPIELKLEEAVIEKANKYLLYNESNPSAELDPLKTWTDVSTLSLAVPDYILVLEFTAKSSRN